MSATIDIATTATDRPPVLSDRALFGHPRGLGLLFIVEMWERFSYYGMRALLVLYLVNALKWSGADATNLYGTYTMLVYLTPVIGGFLADRLIGTRRSLVIGAIVIALGHFTLAFPGMPAFYLGLALIIIGTGFFKANVSTMVGQIYSAGDARRDSGFTIFYMGINLGAFIGPLICGGLAQSPSFGWHYGFAAAGVGMVLGLITYLWGRSRYLPGIGVAASQRDRGTRGSSAAEVTQNPGNSALMHGTGGAIGGGIVGWFLSGGGILGIAFGLIIGAVVSISMLGSQGEERKRVFALFIMVFFVIFFWAAYEQAGSSMNLFADKNTDLSIHSFTIPGIAWHAWRPHFVQWHTMSAIPSSWYQSVNPFAILVFAPVFAAMWSGLGRRGREPATALKMVAGLFLLGVGFVFMVLGGKHADAGVLVSPVWLLAAYTFHTLGELCLSPVGLSYVTKVAPARFASLLMGAWFLANAAANKIAGALAAFTPLPGQAPAAPAAGLEGFVQHVSATNAGFYSIFVVSSFGAGIVMLLCVPLLKRLTASVPSVDVAPGLVRDILEG